MPCSISWYYSSQKSLKPMWLHIHLKYRRFKQITQFNVINKPLLKREKNALAQKSPQLDVLVGEAEEGLEAHGAFLVLRPLLLPLLSSFLLTLTLLQESIPAPFTRPICTLESFIQTEVTLGICAAETTFKRPQALRLGVILLMKCLDFFYST